MVNIQLFLTPENFVLLSDAVHKLCKYDPLKIKLALKATLTEAIERLWLTPELTPLEFARVNCNIVKLTVLSLAPEIHAEVSETSKNTSNRQEVVIGPRIFDIQEHHDDVLPEETPLSAIKDPH